MRKTNLAQLLRGRPDRIFVAPLERSSRARSVPTCFEPPATWGSRGWCRSGRIRPYPPDDRKTG
jgi:hypothetical protein